MEDNGVLYLALICTSVVLEPCWFFGDSSCFVSPSSHVVWGDTLGGNVGNCVIPEEGIVMCLLWDGDTVEWLDHREHLPDPFSRSVLV